MCVCIGVGGQKSRRFKTHRGGGRVRSLCVARLGHNQHCAHERRACERMCADPCGMIVCVCVYVCVLSSFFPPPDYSEIHHCCTAQTKQTETHMHVVWHVMGELAKLLQLDSTMVAGKERRGKGKRCSKQTLMGVSRTALHAPTHLPYRTASHYTSV